MSYRVKIKHRELPPGHVSLQAAATVLKALRIAVRVEAASLSAKKSARGRLGKLQRESTTMTLVGVERGSGVLVFESESATLIDVPGAAFDDMIAEANRARDSAFPPNLGMQRALLALDTLFRRDSDIAELEFISERGGTATVDDGTMTRIRSSMEEQAHEHGAETSTITGRLLELDLARKSFRIYNALGDIETVRYADMLEQLVVDALDAFVAADIVREPGGQRELISLEVLESPGTRFNERQSLTKIIREQHLSTVPDIDFFAMSDVEHVPLEQFDDFIRTLRRGGES